MLSHPGCCDNGLPDDKRNEPLEELVEEDDLVTSGAVKLVAKGQTSAYQNWEGGGRRPGVGGCCPCSSSTISTAPVSVAQKIIILVARHLAIPIQSIFL
jgi:hypothetical protein